MFAIGGVLTQRVALLERYSIPAPIFIDLMNLAVLTFFLLPGFIIGR